MLKNYTPEELRNRKAFDAKVEIQQVAREKRNEFRAPFEQEVGNRLLALQDPEKALALAAQGMLAARQSGPMRSQLESILWQGLRNAAKEDKRYWDAYRRFALMFDPPSENDIQMAPEEVQNFLDIIAQPTN